MVRIDQKNITVRNLKKGRIRHIAVEGAIGVGKTSLAEMIASDFGGVLALEEPEKNPFLPDFYNDPARWAFQTQITFLLARHRRQLEFRQRNMFHELIVSDYMFEKNHIFARLTLDDREFDLYNKISGILETDVAKPDLVIFLKSVPRKLMTNIKIRDIEYERSIELEYLSALCEIYNSFFKRFSDSTLIEINATQLDFVHNLDHKRLLLDTVKSIMDRDLRFGMEVEVV